MTNEEAIKHLNAITKWTNFFGGCYLEKLEAINMAVSALDKQIPRKPVKTCNELYPIECPICRCGYMDDVDYGFCIICGQALDWS